MDHHGEAAAGGSNSGGKSLFQETAGGQTANAPPTKRLSSEESSEHTTSIRSCFNIGIVFTLLKVSRYATFDGKVVLLSHGVVTGFCPAEGALTAPLELSACDHDGWSIMSSSPSSSTTFNMAVECEATVRKAVLT